MMVQLEINARVAEMFKLYDLDGSGFITLDENLKLDKKMAELFGQPFDEEKCKEQFKKTDANSDGKVTEDEFRAFITKEVITPIREQGMPDEMILMMLMPIIELLRETAGKYTLVYHGGMKSF